MCDTIPISALPTNALPTNAHTWYASTPHLPMSYIATL